MDLFAATCAEIAKHGSRLKKVAILARYLTPLPDDDFRRAVQFLSAGPVTTKDERRFSLGHATLRDAALAVTGWDLETVRSCYHAVGDTGETISLLLAGRTANEPLTLAEAESIYARLFTLRRTAERVLLLQQTFTRYRPDTLKYFIKVLTGNFRIGLQERMVEEAVAASLGVSHDDVRAANNRLGNLAAVAMAARNHALHEVEARLFHPMDFMLAKPLDALEDLTEPTQWAIEDKYDGIRAQAHFENGNVKLFTRGLEDVTHSYPEVVTALQFLPGSGVLDGEVMAYRDNRALAFTVLQQRLARKRVTREVLEEIPVVYMAYDMLNRNGQLVLDQPLTERRALLEQAMEGQPLPLLLSQQWKADTTEDVDRLFSEARARGNEGLLLKKRDSRYESGKRGGSWLKLKRTYGTLDVVITAAEQGHGRRAIFLSDYTFAVRDGERFVNVGKAYSGLTDPEVKELTKILKAASLDRFGRTILVKPEVVLEVTFDGVQKSPRHKSGYALRFPRILRWRQDKLPAEADTLDRMRELYEASLHAPPAETTGAETA